MNTIGQRYYKLIQETFKKLDADYYEGKKIENAINRTEIVSYLTFFEMMCSLMIKGVLKIEDVDALYAYPFFIAMNNKEIQDIELVRCKQFYKNIYTIYPKWFKYCELNGSEIPYRDNKLI